MNSSKILPIISRAMVPFRHCDISLPDDLSGSIDSDKTSGNFFLFLISFTGRSCEHEK